MEAARTPCRNAIGSCFGVSSAVADACGQASVCGYAGLANAKSCASFYGSEESSLYNSYGSACMQAFDALLECTSQLSCGAYNSACPSQLSDYYMYCS